MLKILRSAHRWIGVVAALLFVVVASTGVLLLLKKRIDWIQPPIVEGTPGTLEQVITMPELYEAVLASGHSEFRVVEDIDRVDYRPQDHLFKVLSRHQRAEIQVCATTGEVLSVDSRLSDLIEDIHDGSYFGAWVHEWLMPVLGIGVVILTVSGVWLWLVPVLRKRRRARKAGSARGDVGS